jgi:hypothetical protein
LETRTEGGVAVRRTEALPELKARTTQKVFQKKKGNAHEGGVIFRVGGIPEGKKWGDVKDLLKVVMPQGSKVVFSTATNGEGADRHCHMLASVFENDLEFFQKLSLEFDLGESKVQLKIEVLDGDDLKKALTNMPRHVQKKRQDAAMNFKKANQKPIFIGEQKFGNANAVRAKVKEVLAARTDGQALRPDSPDYQFIHAVLQFHPRAKEGKLEGMTGLKVDRHTQSNTRCFFVVKGDSCDDISIMKCIQGIEANPPVAAEKVEEKVEVKSEEKVEVKSEEKVEVKAEEKVEVKSEEKPVEVKAEEKPAETTA